MTSKKTVVLIAVVVALVVAFGAIAMAKAGDRNGATNRKPGTVQAKCEKFGGALGLTDDQKAKIKSICDAYKPQFKALRDDTTLTPEQKKAKAQELRAKMQAEMSAVLTPEQQKKLDEMKTKFQKKSGKRGIGDGMRHVLGQLGLTDDQKAKVKAIFDSHKGELKAIHEDTTLTKEQKMAKAKVIMEGIRAEVRQVLTPEQQKKLDEMIQQGFKKMQDKRGEKPAPRN